MKPLPTILASLLILPMLALPAAFVEAAPAHAGDRQAVAVEGRAMGPGPLDSYPFGQLAEAFRVRSAGQVSIEQRIIIRISPRAPASPDPRVNLMSELPERAVPPSHLEERSMAKCVPVGGIAGVQIAPSNKLVLLMRDSRRVSAGLDKGCNARDFYSGFYVERSNDGMICSGRDKLQSRSGASCKLGKLHQLVEVDD